MEPINFSGRRMGLPDTSFFSTLYGPLYNPKSPLADKNGFRKDYIDAMRELKITNMRWPGGNFVMGYDWKDGIGPQNKRPRRLNLAWGGYESNEVGTDEWIALNKAIGSENVVCVNLGLGMGSILDACYWVEYCNHPKGTYYSDFRIKNGNPQPYNVKIWDLGNEVDGYPWELGHMSADDYVKVAREAAKAMRSVDRSIKLVASGSSYYEPTRTMKGFKNPIYISFDEWGIMGRNFLSVLPVAQCFNSFIRNADIVKMANFTMLTSLLQEDREKGTFKTPLFYMFKSFSNNCHGFAIDTYVQCDTFNTNKYKGIPYLDVTSVYNPSTNTIMINVVNRHKDEAITAEVVSVAIPFINDAEVTVINQNSLDEPFSFDKKDKYVPSIKQVQTNGNKLVYTFEPHSFTQIKVKIKEL